MRSEELHIAEFCLQYLNFGCFDADLTDLEIRAFFRQGYYSFEDYAIAHWLDHVDSSTSQIPTSEDNGLKSLGEVIQLFFMKRGLDPPPDVSLSTDQRFQSIRLGDCVRRLNGLAQLARQRKTNESYLDLETQLQRRRLIYEDMVTNIDPDSEQFRTFLLLNEFGLFKCPKTWCKFFSGGFQLEERRDRHVNQHERPFRCTVEACLHAELGYETEKDLKRHVKTSHPTSESSEWDFPMHKPKQKLNIMSASRKGDLETVQRLVGEGADVEQRSGAKGQGKTPLGMAVKYDHADVVRYLLGQGCRTNYDLFRDAVRHSSISISHMLLENGTDPEVKKERAQGGLGEAAAYGRADAIPLLLTYGIDINYRYPALFGRTPLQISRLLNYQACVQVLLENGALDETSQSKEPSVEVANRNNCM